MQSCVKEPINGLKHKCNVPRKNTGLNLRSKPSCIVEENGGEWEFSQDEKRSTYTLIWNDKASESPPTGVTCTSPKRHSQVYNVAKFPSFFGTRKLRLCPPLIGQPHRTALLSLVSNNCLGDTIDKDTDVIPETVTNNQLQLFSQHMQSLRMCACASLHGPSANRLRNCNLFGLFDLLYSKHKKYWTELKALLGKWQALERLCVVTRTHSN